MPKELSNPLQYIIEFDKDDGHILVCTSAHYGIICEYGDLGRKGLPITLTPAQENQIKAFAASVLLPQIKANEGIQ